MIRKLTATVLALVIAGPLCCCSWMHQAAEAKSEAPCCHAKSGKDKAAPAAPKEKDCPCSQTPKVRGLVASDVTVPAAKLVPQPYAILPETAVAALKISPASTQNHLLPVDHGPPRPAVPLYLRDCALLI